MLAGKLQNLITTALILRFMPHKTETKEEFSVSTNDFLKC